MEKTKEEKIMYRIHSGEKPESGMRFKFRPNILQRIFGFETFGKFMLLENQHFGNGLVKVKVPKGAMIEETAWGALVSECTVI